jgi:uncharacterized protein (TIGR01244 family)
LSFKQLDAGMFVAPQIDLAEVDMAHDQGITCIINNRPDDEEAGQISGAEIARHAAALGLDYHAIPVTHAGFSTPQIEAMAVTLHQAKGPVLAFCRSGTRSTLLWALAQASAGAAPDGLEQKAQAAGYSLAPIRALLNMLAAQAKGA